MKNLKDERELLTKPGDTIIETLEVTRMSQTELAERMGKTPSKINDIISGKEPITINTALQLEKVLGIDAQFWLNRESIYREKLLRIEQEEFLEQCTGWLKDQPIKELKKLGYIQSDKSGPEMVNEMLHFYGVVSPNEYQKLYVNEYASTNFRKSNSHTAALGSIAAWLRIGELELRKFQLPPFDKDKFKASLGAIKEIARKQPENFAILLKDICHECGIALIYCYSLPHAPISGATRWIGGIPVIQITDRYKRNDQFWFTFFHEAGHILLHGKKDVFLEEFEGYVNDEKKENEADHFSREWLLPSSYLNNLPESIADKEIRDIARAANIHPGIVVGRLQRLGKVAYSFGENFKFKVDLKYFISEQDGK